MSSKLESPDPEQLRAEKILKEMERQERRGKSSRALGCLPWVLFAALVLAIVVVALTQRGQLSGYWQRFVKPDSIPGLGR
jgi:hypothetical protein